MGFKKMPIINFKTLIMEGLFFCLVFAIVLRLKEQQARRKEVIYLKP